MKSPTLYHKRTLISLFIKAHHYRTVTVTACEEDAGFNRAFEEAREYFNSEA